MKSEDREDSAESPKIRSLLRLLRHETAPWHFEARLKQRISEERKRKTPVYLRPAFALPAAGIAAALVLYVWIPPSDDTVVLPVPTQPDRSEQSSEEGGAGPAPAGEDQKFMLQSDTSPGRGPSAESPDPYLPATLGAPEGRGPEGSMISPGSFLDAVDSTGDPVQTISDSLDSLSFQGDSLKRKE